MRLTTLILGAGLLSLSASVFPGEFNNECSWGLANGKHVKTDCKVNAVREDGVTYCFSSDKAMEAFMKDAPTHVKKAKEVFGRA